MRLIGRQAEPVLGDGGRQGAVGAVAVLMAHVGGSGPPGRGSPVVRGDPPGRPYSPAVLAALVGMAAGMVGGAVAARGAGAEPFPDNFRGTVPPRCWSGAAGAPTTPPTATPAPDGGPFPPLVHPVHVPVLNYEGHHELCRSWIAVQSIGDEPGKAVLLVWRDATDCAPRCSGPLAVECSGLIRPGGSWIFQGAALPAAARSGIVYSFNARLLSEIGVDPGFDDVVADLLCETLFFGVKDDCDDFGRFRDAYEQGGEFAGIPLARAYGPALAAEVRRACPGDRSKVMTATSGYAGISGPKFGGFDRVFDVSSYHATLVYGDRDGSHTVVYVQNGGEHCASVEVWVQSLDECRQTRLCDAFSLAQGTTVVVDAADCVGPEWEGTAWLNSTEPLAIAVDVIGSDALMTYTAVPAELRYAIDQPPLFSEGSPVAYGPLIYGPNQGWEGRVHVQNLSSGVTARVRAFFLDAAGSPVVRPREAWICPRGTETFGLAVTDGWPDPPYGSVRVESWQGVSADGKTVEPPNISAVVDLQRNGGARDRAAPETLVYNLLSEQRSFDWPAGNRRGGTESGVGLIAIPSLLNEAGQLGVTTELAVANLVPNPGFTNVAILVYDRNGAVDARCRQLRQLEVAYIDAGAWGHLSPGFSGSALISAVGWRHPVPDLPRGAERNLVGLAAVVVQRGGHGGRPDGELAGDVSGATTGVPVRRAGPGLVSALNDDTAGGLGCPPLPENVPTATPDLVRPVFLPMGWR